MLQFRAVDARAWQTLRVLRLANELRAEGYRTPAQVVDGWRESTGHCHNLMGTFEHLGVGYAEVAGAPSGSYWVQMFGTRRG